MAIEVVDRGTHREVIVWQQLRGKIHEDLRRVLCELIEAPAASSIHVNLEGCSSLTSGALEVLVQASDRVARLDPLRPLVLVRVNEVLRAILVATRLWDRFRIEAGGDGREARGRAAAPEGSRQEGFEDYGTFDVSSAAADEALDLPAIEGLTPEEEASWLSDSASVVAETVRDAPRPAAEADLGADGDLGNPVPPAVAADPESAAALGASWVALDVCAGPAEGRSYVLRPGAVYVVGRSPGVDIEIADRSVSRRHVKLAFDDRGVLHFKDLHSANGTLLNDAQTDRGVLVAGDTLAVGTTTFCVRASAGAPGSPEASAAPAESAVPIGLEGLRLAHGRTQVLRASVDLRDLEDREEVA